MEVEIKIGTIVKTTVKFQSPMGPGIGHVDDTTLTGLAMITAIDPDSDGDLSGVTLEFTGEYFTDVKRTYLGNPN